MDVMLARPQSYLSAAEDFRHLTRPAPPSSPRLPPPIADEWLVIKCLRTAHPMHQ